MGLIVDLITDFLKCLKPNHDRQSKEKSQKVLATIIVFVGLFFLFALFGMLSIRVMVKYLNFYGLIGVYGEMVWLFYGVILGISFAFFGQSFPSFEKKDFSPEKLYQSFKHHLKYLVYFIIAIVCWCGFILLILRFSTILL